MVVKEEKKWLNECFKKMVSAKNGLHNFIPAHIFTLKMYHVLEGQLDGV